MTRTSTGARNRGGTTRQRSVAAAARAAAKRAERARAGAGADVVAGPPVRVGTDDPPPTTTGEPDRRGAPGTAEPAASKAPRSRKTPTAAAPVRSSASARAAGPETREEGTEDRRMRRLRGRPGVLRALLVVVTAAAVTAAAFLGWEYREAESTRQARTEAADAARKAAPVILSYDHRRLKKDFAAARGHLTGDFLKKFEKTTLSVVAPTAKKYDGVVKATVAEPASGGAPAVSVVSASPEKVVVLLFVNQVTESKKLSEPRMDLNRVRMTMVDTPDGWKVGTLDAL